MNHARDVKPGLAGRAVGKHHYDIGNDLYRGMLGERLIYSCGLWEHAASLEEAQEAKLDLICRKLGLQPGMRVLDIGCGWGGTARYAAQRYQVEVVGITVSAEQVRLAREMCRGLPIEILYQDYRRMEGTFDRILSVGMFEHVGPRNHATFMRVVCIGSATSRRTGDFCATTMMSRSSAYGHTICSPVPVPSAPGQINFGKSCCRPPGCPVGIGSRRIDCGN